MDSAVDRNTEDDSEKQRESGKTMFKAVLFDTNRLFSWFLVVTKNTYPVVHSPNN